MSKGRKTKKEIKELEKKSIKKAKGFINDFKQFATKGNVIDMAVGVIIANAFTKKSKFNTDEIRKVLLYNLWFMTLFAVLDYFLIP